MDLKESDWDTLSLLPDNEPETVEIKPEISSIVTITEIGESEPDSFELDTIPQRFHFFSF